MKSVLCEVDCSHPLYLAHEKENASEANEESLFQALSQYSRGTIEKAARDERDLLKKNRYAPRTCVYFDAD